MSSSVDGSPVSTQASIKPAAYERERPPSKSMSERMLDIWEGTWRPAALLAAILLVWWFVTDRDMVSTFLIPPPGAVVETLVDEFDMLWRHTWATLSATVYGFLWATLLGLATATLIVYSTTLEKAIYPIILFAQVIPKIAIAPILVVWFGFGSGPKIILAVLIAFFPVVISGVQGLRSIDPELLNLSATMGAGRLKTFVKVRFPNALPSIFSGLKVAVTLAVVGAVVGEFVGATEGLGYILLLASGNLQTALLFADLLLMSAIGILLFVIIEMLERMLIPWHASQRRDYVTS